MVISKGELLDLFEEAYEQEQQAAAITKSAKELLKGFADSNEIATKTINSAYDTFKKYKSGKIISSDEDYLTILGILEEHFGGNDDSSEDTVSA